MTSRSLEDATSLELARRQLADRPLRGTSAGRDLSGVTLDEFEAFLVDGTRWMPPRDHHVVTLSHGHSPFVHQERLGRTFESPSQPGEVIMIPAGYENLFRGLLPGHLRIGISQSHFREAAETLRAAGARTEPDIANGFRIRDPWLEHLGALLSLELGRAQHPGQTLLLDSAVTMLTIHLLRNYLATNSMALASLPIASSAAVRRACEFIHDCGAERISLTDIAQAAGISRFHLTREFKRATGLAPFQYLERLRIEQAKAMIRAGQLPLADIAFAVGFSDQSHFTKRFRHHASCTPAVYAREHARTRPARRRAR